MRFIKSLSALSLILAFSTPALAGAQTLSSSGKITVYAAVLPAREIVVDPANDIAEIDSNTTQNVVPSVYLGSIAAGHQTVLTPEVYAQYLRIMSGKNKVGIIKVAPAKPSVGGSNFFTILNRLSI